MTRLPSLTRREWLRLSTAGALGCSMSGWLEVLAADAAANKQRRRSCILLWMNGGPSQMDTFDLKPGHANGGPYKELTTKVPGLRFSEHLPKLARHADRMCLIRSMRTKEADHGRATFVMRTGRVPGGPIQYPPLGAMVAKELGDPDLVLPHYVAIGPYRNVNTEAFGAGFLGPHYVPLVVGEDRRFGGPADYEKSLRVENIKLSPGIGQARAGARFDLLQGLEREFAENRPAPASHSHRSAYERAVKMMRSPAARAFDLDREPAAVRDAYGRNLFGQGCLLARRLVEHGVPFVEVTLGGAPGAAGGWDTHGNNFENVRILSQLLDAGWSSLMDDLKQRGLLDSTLIVWMGEFGRTPLINGNNGRDHWATSWSTVLAGGGFRGGSVVGKTTPDGMEVADRPVSVGDFLATVCLALGIDFEKSNVSNVGRPIRIVDKGAQPVREVIAGA